MAEIILSATFPGHAAAHSAAVKLRALRVVQVQIDYGQDALHQTTTGSGAGAYAMQRMESLSGIAVPDDHSGPDVTMTAVIDERIKPLAIRVMQEYGAIV
ncbi:hypothetical protein [Paenibacillus koleovorans]|uniref:hypothetical protein n=1 Tax=Paenibacillus koleovorans TaxID=121608 RepID=UPI000FD824A3|nr:hypothetical protein [Paenibacillus koleovorans]